MTESDRIRRLQSIRKELGELVTESESKVYGDVLTHLSDLILDAGLEYCAPSQSV